MIETSVLVVGGSLNGLTMALLLADRHVPCVVVERHAKTSLQYKFRGIAPRSMEIFRSLGIESEIRSCDSIDERSAQIARMKNLADPEIVWQGVPWADTSDISPTTAGVCDQDQLEPILKAHAERRGADVRFNTELVAFEQDGEGVTGRIRNRRTGEEETIRATYLVAADGTQGTLRDALGIKRHGPGVLQHWMNVIFETDLQPTLDGRSIRSVFVTDINGTFVPRAGGRWLMAVQYVPDRGERAEDFTNERCLELIRRGAGRREVKAAIVDARSWEAAALVADRYREGRAFLVGDTAHVMPPTGGFGGNTGIHDTYNIAWKLEAVLRHGAGDGLLDTYDAERRPVAEHTMAQSLARLQAWFKDPSKKLPPAEPIIDDYAVIFGYRYPTGAFVDDDADSSPAAFDDPRAPSGQPGSRAPQLIVEHGGHRVSTVDLFAGQWVLYAGATGKAWCDAARRVSERAPFHLQCFRNGPDGDLRDLENRWSSAYGIDQDGAVLIRPDGFIAWRARGGGTDPEAMLRPVFERLTFRNP
jgi:putative polyketide hydroxylase